MKKKKYTGRDWNLVSLLKGATKSGPHRSRKAYDRKACNKEDCLEDFSIEEENGGSADASGSLQPASGPVVCDD